MAMPEAAKRSVRRLRACDGGGLVSQPQAEMAYRVTPLSPKIPDVT
jgi:hypothetical protein